jgi:polyferredoxin
VIGERWLVGGNGILLNKRGSSMIDNRQRRGWVLIAAIAIGFALLLLLVPHGHLGAADFVAILPLLFVGIISPLSLLSPLAYAYAGRVPEAPVVAASFQRPPPFRRG